MKKILLLTLTCVIASFATTGCLVEDRGYHHHWHGQVTPERPVAEAPAALAVNQPEP